MLLLEKPLTNWTVVSSLQNFLQARSPELVTTDRDARMQMLLAVVILKADLALWKELLQFFIAFSLEGLNKLEASASFPSFEISDAKLEF